MSDAIARRVGCDWFHGIDALGPVDIQGIPTDPQM
jgi:hypothetical protein